jgi:hypothetical protein
MQQSQWRHPTWDRECGRCRAMLLKGEFNLFCCNGGKSEIPPLPPLPPNISAVIDDESLSQNLSSHSRRLNNLFSFTAIGATNGFTRFETGISAVAITGRTYHRIFDVKDHSHSLHWFLYDENEAKLYY